MAGHIFNSSTKFEDLRLSILELRVYFPYDTTENAFADTEGEGSAYCKV